jgi:hypothetical protein
MQRDLSNQLLDIVNVPPATSILSATNSYNKYTTITCSDDVVVGNTDATFLHHDGTSLELFKANIATGVLTYKKCDGAACAGPTDYMNALDTTAKRHAIALSACDQIATCAAVTCEDVDTSAECKARQSCTKDDGSDADDVLFTSQATQLAASEHNPVGNPYIKYKGTICNSGGATVVSVESGAGADISWDDDEDDATPQVVAATIGSSGAVTFNPAIVMDSNTAEAAHMNLCAAVCDQHEDCAFFEMSGTSTSGAGGIPGWACKSYSACELKADATDTNYVFAKDVGAVRRPADSSKEWVTKNDYECNNAANAEPVTADTNVAYRGETWTFQVSSDSKFTFKDSAGTDATLTNAIQRELCTAACEDLGDAECKGVLMSGVDAKGNVECKPQKACDPKLTAGDITGINSLGVPDRSIASSTATALFTVDEDATCSETPTATTTSPADDTYGDFTYDDKSYTPVVAAGLIKFKEGTVDTVKAIKDLSAFTASGNQQGLCAAACEQITDCKYVRVVTTTADPTCHAFIDNKCKFAKGTNENFVLTNHGDVPMHPTESPTLGPTAGPSKAPTKGPSAGPSKGPSQGPSGAPSKGPSSGPSSGPSVTPSAPTPGPTHGPSKGPAVPTVSPSGPTSDPTPAPSKPTENPTVAPSKPTPFPSRPTNAPIVDPTPAPSQPTPAPTRPTPAPTQPTPAPVAENTAVVETTSASSTIMALQVVVFLAWALF